ncbi:hypothetical protein M9458_008494, partial [Cirrhinus mrigala]
SNRNVDALSRQGPSSQGELEEVLPGTALPTIVRQAGEMGMGSQAGVTVLPGLAVDMQSLQDEDPVIGEVLRFWRRGVPPNSEERRQLSKAVVTLLRQWGRLCEQDGVVYCRVFRSDGGEEVLQVVLPSLLHHEVLLQLHQEHGHQGMKRTTELVRQRCFWPGLTSDVAQWLQRIQNIFPIASWATFWPRGRIKYWPLTLL